jgi:hypothetical protein
VAAKIDVAGINLAYPVGTMLVAAATGWQIRDLGTVVTRREWSFVEHRTTVQTGYSELDAQVLTS